MTKAPMAAHLDAAALKEHAAQRLEDIAVELWGTDTVRRRTPTAIRFGTKGSKVVHLEGSMRGMFTDFEAGLSGDVFEIWARVHLGLRSARTDFPAVIESLAGFLGVADGAPTFSHRGHRDATINPAVLQKRAADARTIQRIVEASRPVHEVGATPYLASRGIIAVPRTPDLRWLPAAAISHADVAAIYKPNGLSPPDRVGHAALVCLSRNGERNVTGLQRILLERSGHRKANVPIQKPSLGTLHGAVLMLPGTKGQGDDAPILIAEGPETALSLWCATGCTTWATLGSLSSGAPLNSAQPVILCRDVDLPESPADIALTRYADKLIADGHPVRIATPPRARSKGWDFNDVLCHPDLGSQSIKTAIRHAPLHISLKACTAHETRPRHRD